MLNVLRIKALMLLWVGVVQCEYTLPCQTGSLYSGAYQLDESGYFCTEPIRILYNSSSVVQGISSNLGDIYTYGNDVPSFTDQNIQPCNCYSQPIHWKSETLSIANEYPTAAEYVVMIQNKQKETESTLEEWNPLDKNVGTPCVYTQLGYTWAVSSEELPDPMILSIPPGEYISALKTGAGISTFQNPDADPSPCGVVARDVYQTVVLDGNNSAFTATDFNSRPGSMPISDYCASMRPFSVSDRSLNTPTQNVFMATLLRLTAPMEMVRQCKTGIWEAVAMAAGLTQSEGLSDTLAHIQSNLGIPIISDDNNIMVCSGYEMANAVKIAFDKTMQYIGKQKTKNSLFEFNTGGADEVYSNFDVSTCFLTSSNPYSCYLGNNIRFPYNIFDSYITITSGSRFSIKLSTLQNIVKNDVTLDPTNSKYCIYEQMGLIFQKAKAANANECLYWKGCYDDWLANYNLTEITCGPDGTNTQSVWVCDGNNGYLSIKQTDTSYNYNSDVNDMGNYYEFSCSDTEPYTVTKPFEYCTILLLWISV